MSKLNAFAAILKFINGRNDSKKYLQGLFNYITDPAKTDNGNLVLTQICKSYPIGYGSGNRTQDDGVKDHWLHRLPNPYYKTHRRDYYPSGGNK